MFQTGEVDLVATPLPDVEEPLVIVARQRVDERRKGLGHDRNVAPILGIDHCKNRVARGLIRLL